jgi:hypothetical protein
MHLCPLQYDQSLSPERASQIRVAWHNSSEGPCICDIVRVTAKAYSSNEITTTQCPRVILSPFFRAVRKLTKFGASHPTGKGY